MPDCNVIRTGWNSVDRTPIETAKTVMSQADDLKLAGRFHGVCKWRNPACSDYSKRALTSSVEMPVCQHTNVSRCPLIRSSQRKTPVVETQAYIPSRSDTLYGYALPFRCLIFEPARMRLSFGTIVPSALFRAVLTTFLNEFSWFALEKHHPWRRYH